MLWLLAFLAALAYIRRPLQRLRTADLKGVANGCKPFFEVIPSLE